MYLLHVMQAAVRAKEAGSTRFCMGAAWRGPTQVSITPSQHHSPVVALPGTMLIIINKHDTPFSE